MGMDVYGTNPSTTDGEYFRANIWSWRPIWVMTCDLAGDLIPQDVQEGCQTNMGMGLDGETSKAVADRLDGRFGEWLDAFRAHIDSIPKVECHHCRGDGKAQEHHRCLLERTDTLTRGLRVFVEDGKCPQCEGTGKERPTEAWYGANDEHVQAWITFLRRCGGFAVH